MTRDREREVLASYGIDIAYSDEPDAVCPGGQALTECTTTAPMLETATEWKGHENDSGEMWNVLAWLGKTCETCTKVCEVGVQTIDGKPTGLVRITGVERDPSIPVIEIDTKALIASSVTPEELRRFQQDIERIQPNLAKED